jgi:hypothetical protein
MGMRLKMNRRNAARLAVVCLSLVAAVAAGTDSSKPISVKGYVLDSACAFTSWNAPGILLLFFFPFTSFYSG